MIGLFDEVDFRETRRSRLKFFFGLFAEIHCDVGGRFQRDTEVVTEIHLDVVCRDILRCRGPVSERHGGRN